MRIRSTLLAVLVLLGPSASSAQGAFGDNCHLTIERELLQVPLDNAVKYGTLLFLVAIPETSPAALALGREEVASDVRVAGLRGAAACLRDPARRERALEVIAVAKGLDDWRGFGETLYEATGLTYHQFVTQASITDAVAADLGDGFGAFVAEGWRDFGAGRPLGFQRLLALRVDLASRFVSQCQWGAAARMLDDIPRAIDERRPGAVREMIAAARELTGRSMTSEAELLAFDATRYVNTNARAAGDFLRARGDYVVSDRALETVPGIADRARAERPPYEAARRRVDAALADARRALEQCNPPRFRSALMLVSREPGVMAQTPMNRSISLLAGVLAGEREVLSDAELRVSLAGVDGCWADPVADYNALVTDFYRLRDVNVPGRDEGPLRAALAAGRRALAACDGPGARAALAEARSGLPASLDPGDLCIDAPRAEADVSAFAREVEAGLAACSASPTPAPPPAPAAGSLACPAPPPGYEIRATEAGFGTPARGPGEILLDSDYERESSALCAYFYRGRDRGGFGLRVRWYGAPSNTDLLCRRARAGEPLVQSTGTWSLGFSGTQTDEWVGPYADRLSLGSSFDRVYASLRRAATVRLSEYGEDGLDGADRAWRTAAVTQMLRQVGSRAWQCPR